MRKRSFLLVAGACLAALSLTAGSALADPAPPQPPFRALQGVGSGVTQAVMNSYSNGVPGGFNGIRDTGNNLLVASWDATGTDVALTPGRIEATFNNVTCNPPGAATLTRPNGSTAGVNALSGLLAAFPQNCANFARSTINDNLPGLTYIPFALGGVTYATIDQSSLPKNLTLDELRVIYSANGVPGSAGCFGFRPLIPQTGSDTRAFWLTLMQIPPNSLGTCVRDTDPVCIVPSSNPTGLIPENHGCWTQGVGADTKLYPFGIGPWIAQTTNPNTFDRSGLTVLRAINGVASIRDIAMDGITYATLPAPDAGTNLPLMDLGTIYGTSPPPPCASNQLQPLLPSPGLLRTAWDTKVPGPFGMCPNDVTPDDGTTLSNQRNLVPYTVAKWIAQTTGSAVDNHGLSRLRAIDGMPPIGLNPDFPLQMTFFNVVRTAELNNPSLHPDLIRAFGPAVPAGADPPGQICSNPQVLTAHGLAEHPSCGVN